MMYTYPEYLNAAHRVLIDLFTRAHEMDPVRFPFAPHQIRLTVVADSRTGTASVDWRVDQDWRGNASRLRVTVNLPVKAATYRLTEQEFQHGIAYMLHEIGHPLHTDKHTWDSAVARRAHNLLNSLEDVREEKATIDLGLAVNALQMFSGLIDSLHAKAVATSYDPNNTRSIGWTLSTLGRAANGYDLDCSDIYGRLDPAGVVFQICGWALPMLAQCKSTQDCLDLADKVTDALRAANKPNKPEQEPEAPEPDLDPESEIDEGDYDDGGDDYEETEEEAADAAREAEAEAEREKDGEGEFGPQGEAGTVEDQHQDAGEDSVGGEGSVASKHGDQPEPQPEPEVPADDLVDDVDMTPNKSETITSASRDWHAQSVVNEEVRRALTTTIKRKPIVGRTIAQVDGKGRDSILAVTQDASKMGKQRSLLAAALKREETDDREGGRMHGRLDRRAMSRLVQGNPHVFAKRITAEGYDTDVEILLDGSSSMGVRDSLAATTVGLVIAQACAQVGVPCSASLFTEAGLHSITTGRAKPLARKFAYTLNQVEGCTPLTRSMLGVAVEQQRRAPGKRRIIFLVTDGGCDLGSDVLKAAGEYVERVIGAEVANVHIGYEVMGVFRNEVAVDTRDVSATGLQSLTRLLERGL